MRGRGLRCDAEPMTASGALEPSGAYHELGALIVEGIMSQPDGLDDIANPETPAE